MPVVDHGVACEGDGLNLQFWRRNHAGTHVMLGHSTRPVMPLFRVPPFPHARDSALMWPDSRKEHDLSDEQLDAIMESTASSRVGGTYWGEQPPLPDLPYVLVRVRDATVRSDLLSAVDGGRMALVWLHSRGRGESHEAANTVT